MADLRAEFEEQVAATIAALRERGITPETCTHIADEAPEEKLSGWVVTYYSPDDNGTQGDPTKGYWTEKWGQSHLYLTEDGRLVWCHFRGQEGSAIQGTDLQNWHMPENAVGSSGKPFSAMTEHLQRLQYRG